MCFFSNLLVLLILSFAHLLNNCRINQYSAESELSLLNFHEIVQLCFIAVVNESE